MDKFAVPLDECFRALVFIKGAEPLSGDRYYTYLPKTEVPKLENIASKKKCSWQEVWVGIIRGTVAKELEITPDDIELILVMEKAQKV